MRIQRLQKQGMGIVKIGRTLGGYLRGAARPSRSLIDTFVSGLGAGPGVQ
jgi:hypothetical protein